MTATLIFERMNSHISAFPLEELQSIYGKSYYKLYQLKLKQYLKETQSRQQHESKYINKTKRVQIPFNDKRPEYMNHFREKLKKTLQNDEYNKRASSVVGITNRRTKDTITYTITTTTAIPKPILKPKRSSTKRQRIISAPANRLKKIPIIQIEDTDDDLSKSNGRSYTQVSSSSENHSEQMNEYARQSVSNTIMLHLYSSTPSNLSKWDLYRDFDEKFSASISPRVYRNYERVVL